MTLRLAMVAFLFPLATAAQTSACRVGGVPLALVGDVRLGAPLKFSTGAEVVYINKCASYEEYSGLAVRFELGLAGRQVSFGTYKEGKPRAVGRFALAHIHTWKSPWWARTNQDYYGMELRLSIMGAGFGIGAFGGTRKSRFVGLVSVTIAGEAWLRLACPGSHADREKARAERRCF